MDLALYAARVETLLQDKTLARAMGERGRKTIAQSFSFGSYIDGLELLFMRAAARSDRQADGYGNLKD